MLMMRLMRSSARTALPDNMQKEDCSFFWGLRAKWRCAQSLLTLQMERS